MPKQKDDNKVRIIFEAALQLVLKTGYAGLKMSAVAKEAKIATGTIYTYFESKDLLINELFRDLKKRKMDEVFKQYKPDLPFYDGFKMLWTAYLTADLKEPERSLFIDQYQHSDVLDIQTKTISKTAYHSFYELLENAKSQSIIKDIPTEIMAAQLIGGAKEVARLYFGNADNLNQAIIEQCFEMAWNSIRK